jgi:hypothetical protein
VAEVVRQAVGCLSCVTRTAFTRRRHLPSAARNTPLAVSTWPPPTSHTNTLCEASPATALGKVLKGAESYTEPEIATQGLPEQVGVRQEIAMIQPIIVVGPGRCGTSCVAGVLHHLGVFMGLRLVAAHASNPYGHWEDCDFLELNVAFLNLTIARSEWEKGIRQLIKRRNALQIPCGWKDPRTCNLLRDYLEFFDNPKFIRCIRSAAQIEASIVRAYGENGWTPTDAHVLRVRREQELDQYLPRYNTFEVDFTELRTDRRKIVESLVQFCGLAEVTAQQIRSAINSVRSH